MKMSLYKLYQSVGTSLWLIPVLCVLIGALISFATIALDRANDYQLIPPSLIGGPDAALGILTTVATSMVSLTALVLTIVLVVVQLAMGQFSPRIVQRLLRDRPSQLAIGLFVATFVHTLLALREVQLGDLGEPGQVPGVAVIATFVLALASIATLVMYVHHVGQALRVSALVELAGSDTRKLVDKVYPDPGTPTVGQVSRDHVTATKSGVVTTIAHDELVKIAHNADCVLELMPALGEYVPAGSTLFRVRGDVDRLDGDAARRCVILRLERTLDQDVGYGLRLLVDVAERSLSESPWQDPTTAVQAVDRLHDCLRQLVRRPFPDGRHHDEEGELRFIERVMTWDDYVHLAFDEIRLAGAGSPPVARRLEDTLRDLRAIAPDHRRAVLDEQLELLASGTADAFGSQAEALMGANAHGHSIGDAGGGGDQLDSPADAPLRSGVGS